MERVLLKKQKKKEEASCLLNPRVFCNHKSDQFRQMVDRLLVAYREMGCLMSVKVHFLMCHLDFFPDNLGDFSDEHGERMHQVLRFFEINFKSNWDINMLCDYMWFTLKECDEPRPRNDNERRYFVFRN